MVSIVVFDDFGGGSLVVFILVISIVDDFIFNNISKMIFFNFEGDVLFLICFFY